jgi:hypothetical protein
MKDQIHTYLDKISNYVTNDNGSYYSLPIGYSDERLAMEIAELDFWQPIETAPKDGTWIQGWDDGVGYLGYISMCTHYEFWTADGMSPVFPNKWQPLPNPPKQ